MEEETLHDNDTREDLDVIVFGSDNEVPQDIADHTEGEDVIFCNTGTLLIGQYFKTNL